MTYDDQTPKGFLCFALNNFGEGGHPEATDKNLNFFQVPYIRECVKRALDSEKVAVEAKRLANAYLVITGGVPTE